jgi:hypothetical protein
MPQRPLWPDPPPESPLEAPIFRRHVTTELYVCPDGQFVERWHDAQDSVLFTVDGDMTDDEAAAVYVITRHEGIRVGYAVWRAHTPGPYERELLFRLDAGYAHHSADTQAWRVFVRASRVIPLSAIVDTRCLGGPA